MCHGVGVRGGEGGRVCVCVCVCVFNCHECVGAPGLGADAVGGFVGVGGR